jgi:hypothetical protein
VCALSVARQLADQGVSDGKEYPGFSLALSSLLVRWMIYEKGICLFLALLVFSLEREREREREREKMVFAQQKSLED